MTDWTILGVTAIGAVSALSGYFLSYLRAGKDAESRKADLAAQLEAREKEFWTQQRAATYNDFAKRIRNTLSNLAAGMFGLRLNLIREVGAHPSTGTMSESLTTQQRQLLNEIGPLFRLRGESSDEELGKLLAQTSGEVSEVAFCLLGALKAAEDDESGEPLEAAIDIFNAKFGTAGTTIRKVNQHIDTQMGAEGGPKTPKNATIGNPPEFGCAKTM